MCLRRWSLLMMKCETYVQYYYTTQAPSLHGIPRSLCGLLPEGIMFLLPLQGIILP